MDLSYTTQLSGKSFLDSVEYGGFLYLRPTMQSMEGLDLPQPHQSFLFAVLLTRFGNIFLLRNSWD